MTLFYSDLQTMQNGPASGQPLVNRFKANRVHGRMRWFEATFVAPSSGTAPAIGDKIVWGKLPLRARILGDLGKLYFDAGTAACTLNLGDSMLAARHLAATAINAAGSAVPSVSAFTCLATANVTVGLNYITITAGLGAFTFGDKVTGTGIPAGTTVTSIQGANVYLSQVATATNTGVTITCVGSTYETTDDANNIANNFGSTTDDCTLISVVAGAQIANNQAISLRLPYTVD